MGKLRRLVERYWPATACAFWDHRWDHRPDAPPEDRESYCCVSCGIWAFWPPDVDQRAAPIDAREGVDG